MKERALLFGERKSLVGVITEPATPPPPERPAVLFLNAGVVHRVGPNRIHVRLARELARHGLLSMRFDFSGLGDSRPRADPTPFAQAAVAETRQAMDVLASTRGARSFVLVGICSGADNALRAAGHDGRVAGAVLIEPYTIPAPAFVLYQYRRKILDPRSWWRLLRGRSEVLGTMRERRAEEAAPRAAQAPVAPVREPALDSIVPSAEEFVRQVHALVERGTGLCLIYSSESPAYFNYLSLLRRKLRPARAAGRVRLRVLKRTDHTFTPLDVQEELMRTVRDWALTLPGAAPRTP